MWWRIDSSWLQKLLASRRASRRSDAPGIEYDWQFYERHAGTYTDPYLVGDLIFTWEEDSLSFAAAENAASRVFNGVHWRYDGTEGVRAGNAIADLIYDTLLRPVGGGGPSAIPDADFETQIDAILTGGDVGDAAGYFGPGSR